MRVCVQRAWGGRPTYCFIELHLLLQVQADDAVVVVDAVAVEVIHLSYNQNQGISQSPWPSTGQQAGLLCSVAPVGLRAGPVPDRSLCKEARKIICTAEGNRTSPQRDDSC